MRYIMTVTALLFGLYAPIAKAETAPASAGPQCSEEDQNILERLQQARKDCYKPKKKAAPKPAKPPVPGPAGPQGPAGADGASVDVEQEPAGANCANGGAKFTSNGKTAYVCNGAPGAAGEPGQAGVSLLFEKESPPTFRIGVGGLGFAAAIDGPHGHAAGYGPMLQLQAFRSPKLELTIGLALALGLDSASITPDKTRAWIFETGITYWAWSHVGLMVGSNFQAVGLKPNAEKGMLYGITPGVAFQAYLDKNSVTRLRVELKPFIGTSSFDDDGDAWYGAYGGSATAVLSF